MMASFTQTALSDWKWSPRYGFDIETTGLRHDQARVTTFAIYGENVSIVRESDDEESLLRDLRKDFSELLSGTVVTWNGAAFDGPFLAGRLEAHQMYGVMNLAPNFAVTPKYEPQPGFAPIGFDPIFRALGGGMHSHLDIAYGYWREWADGHGVHWALKPVAKAAGLEVIEVDRTHIGELTAEERRAYCLSDARLAYHLAEMAFATVWDMQQVEKETKNA